MTIRRATNSETVSASELAALLGLSAKAIARLAVSGAIRPRPVHYGLLRSSPKISRRPTVTGGWCEGSAGEPAGRRHRAQKHDRVRRSRAGAGCDLGMGRPGAPYALWHSRGSGSGQHAFAPAQPHRCRTDGRCHSGRLDGYQLGPAAWAAELNGQIAHHADRCRRPASRICGTER